MTAASTNNIGVQTDSPIRLRHFTPSRGLPALIGFLNAAFAGHRHYAPITEADFAERVLVQPAFDPQGSDPRDGRGRGSSARCTRSSHRVRSRQTGAAEPRHHVAWLAVEPEYRKQRLGMRLLNAAENYLYYCPMYFAAQNAPFYGIIERLWVPWYGSTESMAISASQRPGSGDSG